MSVPATKDTYLGPEMWRHLTPVVVRITDDVTGKTGFLTPILTEADVKVAAAVARGYQVTEAQQNNLGNPRSLDPDTRVSAEEKILRAELSGATPADWSFPWAYRDASYRVLGIVTLGTMFGDGNWPTTRQLEVSFWYATASHNQGHGTLGLFGVLRMAFDLAAAKNMVIVSRDFNDASIRVITRRRDVMGPIEMREPAGGELAAQFALDNVVYTMSAKVFRTRAAQKTTKVRADIVARSVVHGSIVEQKLRFSDEPFEFTADPIEVPLSRPSAPSTLSSVVDVNQIARFDSAAIAELVENSELSALKGINPRRDHQVSGFLYGMERDANAAHFIATDHDGRILGMANVIPRGETVAQTFVAHLSSFNSGSEPSFKAIAMAPGNQWDFGFHADHIDADLADLVRGHEVISATRFEVRNKWVVFATSIEPDGTHKGESSIALVTTMRQSDLRSHSAFKNAAARGGGAGADYATGLAQAIAKVSQRTVRTFTLLSHACAKNFVSGTSAYEITQITRLSSPLPLVPAARARNPAVAELTIRDMSVDLTQYVTDALMEKAAAWAVEQGHPGVIAGVPLDQSAGTHLSL